MEHLFMQIFERRDWIASQLRQQEESYAQSVASNLLAAGGLLPPWLWNAAADTDGWKNHHTQGLNRDQMISGILYNLPQTTTPINHTAYYAHSLRNDANGLQSRSFVTKEYDLGDFHRLRSMQSSFRESCAGENDKPDIVMDSFDRLQESCLEHRKKKFKPCNREKLDDDLRKQRSVSAYTGRMTRSKLASMKTYNAEVPLDLKSLPGEMVDDRKNSSYDSSAARFTSFPPKDDGKYSLAELAGTSSQAFEHSQEPHRLKEEEVNLSSPCQKGPGELHASENCQVTERNHHQKAGEDRMSASLFPNVLADSSIDVPVGIQADSDFSSCAISLGEINDTVGSVDRQKELVTDEDTPDLPYHQNTSRDGCYESTFIETVAVAVAVADKENSNEQMNRSTVLPSECVSYSCDSDMAISNETTPEFEGFSIEKPMMQNGFTFDHPNLEKLTSERAAILEQLHRSMNMLEESSVDVHVGNQSDQDFQGAIPLEEMKDTIGSVACKKEFATDEDAIDLPDVNKTSTNGHFESVCVRSVAGEAESNEEMNCNDTNGSAVVEKELVTYEESVDILDIQNISADGCFESTCIKIVTESNEDMNRPISTPLGVTSNSDDSEIVIFNEIAPEFEGFSIENPIVMSGFIFDDPNLQKLTKERATVLQQIQRSMNNHEVSSVDVHDGTQEEIDFPSRAIPLGEINESSRSVIHQREIITDEDGSDLPDMQKGLTKGSFEPNCVESVVDELKLNEEMECQTLLSSGRPSYSDDSDMVLSRESHKVSYVCKSLPAENMRTMSMDGHHLIYGTDNNILPPKDDNLAAVYQNTVVNSDDSFLRRSGSRTLPLSSSQICHNVITRPPCTPIEKFSQKAFVERKGCGLDRLGSNTGLTCFPIDENSRSLKENVYASKFRTTCNKLFGSRDKEFSVSREPLADVTSIYQNAATIVPKSEKKLDRSVLGSVKKELYLPSKMNEDKNQDDIRGSYTTLKVDKKKDVSLSVSGNKEQEDVEALHDVPNKIPLKASEQKRSQAILEKKTINIVSNVQSFIPLVRQKQQAAAAPITGRRDIKVKALEVAEAAKRLAEKRECERKMRKEAVRLERIKSEQENARQLELKQKQKEEDWKKKEAAMAARKRQREEERKEKQRKRNCKEHEVKELQCRAADEKERRRKALSDEATIPKKSERRQDFTAAGHDSTKIIEDARYEANNNSQFCGAPTDSMASGKLIRSSINLLHTLQDRNTMLKENRQSQSYEISPYRDSDDEELQEDKRHKKKFIPSWARRESLDGHLISMRQMDPRKIFCRKRSFNLSEVLPYRTRQQLL